jgi:hypothetical protein
MTFGCLASTSCPFRPDPESLRHVMDAPARPMARRPATSFGISPHPSRVGDPARTPRLLPPPSNRSPPLYYAPGACHAPHHAPWEWIERYREKFDLAIGIALSPVAIIALILILTTPAGRRNGIAFTVGWIIGLAVACSVLSALLNGFNHAQGSPSTVGRIVNLVLGLLRGPCRSDGTATPNHRPGDGLRSGDSDQRGGLRADPRIQPGARSRDRCQVRPGCARLLCGRPHRRREWRRGPSGGR